jgi:hypothetical protein
VYTYESITSLACRYCRLTKERCNITVAGLFYKLVCYKIRFIPGMSRTRIDVKNDPGIDRNDTTTKRVKAFACTGSKAYWSATTIGT